MTTPMIVHGACLVVVVILFSAGKSTPDLILTLYPVVLAFALGAAFLSGRFGSIVAWLVLGSVAWVFGASEAARASGAADAGQAALLIVVALPACLPIAAAAWLGRWLHRHRPAR